MSNLDFNTDIPKPVKDLPECVKDPRHYDCKKCYYDCKKCYFAFNEIISFNNFCWME